MHAKELNQGKKNPQGRSDFSLTIQDPQRIHTKSHPGRPCHNATCA
jgi:hypothetical protein